MILLALLAVLALAGCGTTREMPETVTVTVEKYRDLPAWATDELDKPMAADGTVGARIKSENARGQTIDLANCHRRLLRDIDAGRVVERDTCHPENDQ